MIHIIMGTKAQCIKVAPVIRELDSRHIPYRLIDTCQHRNITADLRVLFGIREPDVVIAEGFSNINSLPKAFRWFGSIAANLLFRKKEYVRTVFGEEPGGVCLIHGDTLSTLAGLMIAKSAGIRVGHLEAGLRSFNILHPFPEELIRLIAMRFSDYLFAPSEEAVKNLRAMHLHGEIVDTHGNTIADSVCYALERGNRNEWNDRKPYAVMSIHRFETIYSKWRLGSALDLARAIAEHRNVIFIMHEPTVKRIDACGLMPQLRHHRIHPATIVGYDHFVSLLNGGEFVITDGGSIQEECACLGVPCLLYRKATEREDGIGRNVCLSGFDRTAIGRFLDTYGTFRRPPAPQTGAASKVIADFLQANAAA